jgi:phage tail-like protein
VSELRPYSLIRDGDQWLRCSFDQVFLNREDGIIELAWTAETRGDVGEIPDTMEGIAFDNACRLYRSRDPGRIERYAWHELKESRVGVLPGTAPEAGAEPLGEFTPADPTRPLRRPRGLAVDLNDRLFIAESGGDAILVYDLWSDRLLRRIGVPGGRPTDLAAHGTTVYAILTGSGTLVRATANTEAVNVELPPGCTHPERVAASPGGALALLTGSGTGTAQVWILGAAPRMTFPEPFATDIEWESDAVVVVARRPGEDFSRYQIDADAATLLHPLRARGYLGLGIIATPESAPTSPGERCHCGGHCRCGPRARRIGYWTGRGFRSAVAARVSYAPLGRVTSYRLDSGEFQTVWGRLFLDACIPEGTSIRVHTIIGDEFEDDRLLEWEPPANRRGSWEAVLRPDLSPPLPPHALVPAADQCRQLFHRRESGRELPWAQPPAEDPFVTIEAPIEGPPGRYLWLTLELRGTDRVTPRVKCLRAEHPTHDYLRRLPRTFSREEGPASFLRRYLAMFEGFLGEIEARAVDRNILLHPLGAPDEVLPWLARFVGLVLDERWARAPRPGGRTQDARRSIIAEATELFRYRGTVTSLRRLLELYLGVPVVLLEHYRLRGLGGAVLGDTGAAFTSSVIGAGFRVGGSVGREGSTPLTGSVGDAFRTHAHRFSVLIPEALTSEQLDVVQHILDAHRPAHTLVDICTVGAGMRVGRGLHVAISSTIGRSGGFATLQLGASSLGRGAIIGRPTGSPAGGAALGEMRVG